MTTKMNAMKKKILLSNAAPKVKLAAIEKLNKCHEMKENATYDELEKKIQILQKELDQKRDAWHRESSKIETAIEKLVQEQRKLEK